MAKKKKRVDKRVDAGKEFLELFTKAKEVLFSPNRFFRKTAKEKELYKPLLYFLVANVIILGAWKIPHLAFKVSMKYGGIVAVFDSVSIIEMWAAWIPVRIAAVFVMAYLVNACAGIFTKKKRSYLDAFKVIVYGETPYSLLGWLFPIIFSIWAVVLYVKGINKAYNIGAWKSMGVLILATVIGAAIIFICSLIFAPLLVR